MSLLGRIVGTRITRGTLVFLWPDGSRESFGTSAPGWPDVALRFHDKQAERRIVTNPNLGMPETFMDGSVTVERGDIMDLIMLVRRNAPWEAGAEVGSRGPLAKFGEWTLSRLDQLNSLARSRRNVAHHYDLSNDFYRLWLDEDMQYSCAYWPDEGMTLEQAQTAKKAHIAAKLALEPGQRVLDIGCGWGGTALYLAALMDVRVHGITLSTEQLALARRRAEEAGVADRVTFELVDYRDLAEREPESFDRIVSIGMFEHVGRPNFATYFACVRKLMTPDGAALIHSIGRLGPPGSTDAFTRKYIFPGGYIPALSETLEASEKVKLIHSDIETWRVHYGRTLRAWYERAVARKDAIVQMYDERFYRMWIFYLAGAAAAFEGGGMGNYQIQYVRDRRALPLSRDYMRAAEERFLGDGDEGKRVIA
ncbi:class I SAM-dependent methyltransferase [Novosphingopyxis sp.]|uniref:class I SAM-dependent methyltransferase n=1 Tax=Novosphingopyxis sp. TaxID=2709690 RepID=UPI003B5CC522